MRSHHRERHLPGRSVQLGTLTPINPSQPRIGAQSQHAGVVETGGFHGGPHWLVMWCTAGREGGWGTFEEDSAPPKRAQSQTAAWQHEMR